MLTRRPSIHPVGSAVPSGARLALAALPLLFAAAPSPGSTAVSCAFSGHANDHADSGIVVASYPGTNIRRLHIGYGANVTGQYLITATIRRGAFDGPIVGTSSIYLNLNANATDRRRWLLSLRRCQRRRRGDPRRHAHHHAHLVGARRALLRRGHGAFDSSGSCGGVYETIGTSSPLDVQVRGTMGIQIDQDRPDERLRQERHGPVHRQQRRRRALPADGRLQPRGRRLRLRTGLDRNPRRHPRRKLLVLRPGQPGDARQGAQRLFDKPQVLGVRQRGNQRGFQSSRSGHRHILGQDVLQYRQRRRGAGPGHVRVPMPVSTRPDGRP